MKKSNSGWLKFIVIAVVAVVLFFIVSAILLVTLVNPNKFKDQISTLVKQNTGREFVIAGDVKWSFFPWIGLRLDELAMGNAPGFNQQAFAKVAEADVSLRLLPLFQGKVEIGKINLKNPVIHLAKNAQGQTNWSDLTHSKTTTNTPPVKTSSVNSAPKNLSKLASLAIGNIDITNATVTWNNAQNGQAFTLDQFNLKTHDVTWGKAFPVSLDFHLKNNKPLLETHLKLSSSVTLDPLQQTYTLNNLQINGDLMNPKFARKQIPYQLQADINSDLNKQTLTAQNVSIKFDTLLAKGNLSGSKILQTPIFTSHITINSFNLRNLLNDLGQSLTMQNPKALTNVSFDSQAEFSPKYLKLSALHAQLDQSNLSGRFSFADFATKRFDFDLAMNAINLDDYSAAAASANAKTTTAVNSNATINKSSSSPFSALTGLNGAGSLKIGKLTANKLTLANLSTQIAANNGVVRLAPLSADLYQGKSQGAVTINAPASSINISNTFSNIQVGPLWQDLAPTSKIKITGLGNVTMQLNTQGSNTTAMKRNLNGNIKFAVTNGVIENLNLNQQIFTAVNQLLKSNTNNSNNNQTSFSSLTGNVLLSNGVANNNDLLLKSTALQVTGKGTANLVTQTLNYTLNVIATGEPFGRDVFDLQTKIGGSFPILISGTFSNPRVTPDLQSLANAFLKGQVKQQINNVIEKNLNGDVGKALQQGIQNLLH